MAKSFMENLIESVNRRKEDNPNLIDILRSMGVSVIFTDEGSIGVLHYLKSQGWKPDQDPVEFIRSKIAELKEEARHICFSPEVRDNLWELARDLSYDKDNPDHYRIDAFLKDKVAELEKTIADLKAKAPVTGVAVAANQLASLQQFRNARNQIIDLLKRKGVIPQSVAYDVQPHAAVNAIAALVDQLDQYKNAYEKANAELQSFKQKLIDLAGGDSSLGGEGVAAADSDEWEDEDDNDLEYPTDHVSDSDDRD